MRPIVKTPGRTIHIDEDNAYSTARNMLLATTGYYCAYCETPLSVDMPVEHKLPKGNLDDRNYFPDFKTYYGNLLLACTSCNSTKGGRPSRTDALTFIKDYFPSSQERFLNDTNIVTYGALGSMAWPDVDTESWPIESIPKELRFLFEQGDPTYKLFSYEKSPATQKDLDENKCLKLSKKELSASWANDSHDMVWIVPNEAYIDTMSSPNIWLARARQTLMTLGLNYYNPNDPKGSDQRVKNRTNAWTVATAALDDLSRVVGIWGLKENGRFSTPVYFLVQAIRQLAVSTGHWSVWMTVFDLIKNPLVEPWRNVATNDGQELIKALFVQYLDWEGIGRVYDFQATPPQVFPGTDLSRVT